MFIPLIVTEFLFDKGIPSLSEEDLRRGNRDGKQWFADQQEGKTATNKVEVMFLWK